MKLQFPACRSSLCKKFNYLVPLCLDLTHLMLYTYCMALERKSRKHSPAHSLWMDVATGAAAAALFILFALLMPKAS